MLAPGGGGHPDGCCHGRAPQLRSTQMENPLSDDDGTSSTSTGSSSRIIAPPWRPQTATRRLTYARGPVTEGLEGELLKQSHLPFGRVTWKRRYFMIKDGMLMYRKSKVGARARAFSTQPFVASFVARASPGFCAPKLAPALVARPALAPDMQESANVRFVANLMYSKVVPVPMPGKQFCFEVRSSLK